MRLSVVVALGDIPYSKDCAQRSAGWWGLMGKSLSLKACDLLSLFENEEGRNADTTLQLGDEKPGAFLGTTKETKKPLFGTFWTHVWSGLRWLKVA